MKKQHPQSLPVLCLIALLITLMPIPVQAQADISCAVDVTVKPGDALTTLASRYYGNMLAYPAIIAATNAKAAVDPSYTPIDDPNVLGLGWKLCIPVSAKTQTAASSPSLGAITPTPAPTTAPFAPSELPWPR